TATGDSTTQLYGGAAGAGITFGGSGSVVVNLLTNTTKAYVDDSTVYARADDSLPAVAVTQWNPHDGKATTQDVRGLAVIASTTETLNVGTASIGLGATLGVGGNLLVTIEKDTTQADINSSNVNDATDQGGVVYVRAHEGSSLTNGGGAGAGGIFAAIALSLNVDTFGNTTTAEISDTAAKTAASRHSVYGAGGVEVNALSREDVTTVAVGVAIGGFAGVAGSAAGVGSTSTTTADIHDANVTSGAGIDVLANSTLTVHFYAGTIA